MGNNVSPGRVASGTGKAVTGLVIGSSGSLSSGPTDPTVGRLTPGSSVMLGTVKGSPVGSCTLTSAVTDGTVISTGGKVGSSGSSELITGLVRSGPIDGMGMVIPNVGSPGSTEPIPGSVRISPTVSTVGRLRLGSRVTDGSVRGSSLG